MTNFKVIVQMQMYISITSKQKSTLKHHIYNYFIMLQSYPFKMSKSSTEKRRPTNWRIALLDIQVHKSFASTRINSCITKYKTKINKKLIFKIKPECNVRKRRL